MEAAKIEQQILQSSKGLPSDILQEILDFIQFVKQKRSANIGEIAAMAHSELSVSESDHLEEEFKNYRTRYPKHKRQ